MKVGLVRFKNILFRTQRLIVVLCSPDTGKD